MKRVFYGWWVVLACSLISFYVAGAIFFGFTAFFEPIAEEFGWSYTQISFAVSLRGLEMGIFAPIVGFLVDRFGPRKVIFWGTIMVGIGLISLSFTQSLTMFYGSILLLAFGAGGCTSVVTMTAVILSAVISLWKIWSIQSSVKAFLLKQVSEFFEFEYREKARLANFNDFSGSGLLPNYSTASTEDHFRGDYHGVEFEFFECSLSQKQGEDSSKEVYHGVLFCFSFPKSFSGETIVLKDQGKIKNLMKGRKQAGERVELEDPRFEKRFEVWGTDPTETRYLLTPTLMERIVELAGAFGSTQLELCLKNNHLLLSVHVTKDQFEGGGMFESVKSKKRVETLVNEITRLFDIVNTLKLNLKTRV
jgi:hypothetical protein